MSYSTILTYGIIFLEFFAALSAIVNYKKFVNSTEHHFLHFLILTFLIDGVISTIVGDVLLMDNTWIYYGFTGISFLFYYQWYYSILKTKAHKHLALLFGCLFVGFYILLGIHVSLHKYSFVLGAFFLLVLTSLYLHQLSNLKHTVKIKYKLSFWITIALVLFNVGMIPFVLLSKYFGVLVENSAFIIILFFLNLILYGCYIIGFTWTKKKYNHF